MIFKMPMSFLQIFFSVDYFVDLPLLVHPNDLKYTLAT